MPLPAFRIDRLASCLTAALVSFVATARFAAAQSPVDVHGSTAWMPKASVAADCGAEPRAAPCPLEPLSGDAAEIRSVVLENTEDLGPTELKVVFLLNVAAFVRWPPPAGASDEREFAIGVRDAPELAAALEKAVAGEKLRGRPIRVHPLRRAQDTLHCHLVYLPAGSEEFPPWPTLQTRPVLTVGETERFEHHGGIVRFVPAGNRLRLRISPTLAGRAGLTVSPQLLRLAEIRG